MEQFGTWLLDGSQEGAIVVAHNLRGYDDLDRRTRKSLMEGFIHGTVLHDFMCQGRTQRDA